MKLVVDGNDGTGKSTLVAKLQELGFEVSDRGIPTKMTDDESIEAGEDELYIILDASVATCQKRLVAAGRSLEERYHTAADLEHYRQRFLAIAGKLGEKAILLGVEFEPELVFRAAVRMLQVRGILAPGQE